MPSKSIEVKRFQWNAKVIPYFFDVILAEYALWPLCFPLCHSLPHETLTCLQDRVSPSTSATFRGRP